MGRRALSDQFEGGAFSDELPGGKASGSIDLEEGMVRFHSENGRVTLPVRGLQITRGGASNRVLFLKHKGCPDWTLFTSDTAILKHPSLEKNEEVARQAGSIRRRRMSGLLALGALIGILALTVIGLVLARGWVVAKLARQVPVSWEEKIGETAFRSMKSKGEIIRDPDLIADLNKISTRLIDGIGSERYTFKFYIVQDSSVNAFALPGGTMAIHTGLLLAADSAEEVAGVMAHELAHVTEQHSVRMLIQAAGLYAVVSALFGDVTGLLAVVANNAPALLAMKFSRDHERQADEYGFDFLTRARVDPRGMVTFFIKLKKKEADRAGPNMPDILKTHPATEKRIAHLEKLLLTLRSSKGTNNFVPIDLNYAAFKEKIRNHLNIKP